MSEFDSSLCNITIYNSKNVEERYEDKYKDIDIFKNYTFQMKKIGFRVYFVRDIQDKYNYKNYKYIFHLHLI